MLRKTAAATLAEVLAGFALLGTSVLLCGDAKVTMCVALMCDRKIYDSVLGVKVHTRVYIAVVKMPHCKGIT